jgi:hypothetical protein
MKVLTYADKIIYNLYPVPGKRGITFKTNLQKEMEKRAMPSPTTSEHILAYEITSSCVYLRLSYIVTMPSVDKNCEEDIRSAEKKFKASEILKYGIYVSEFLKLSKFLKKYEGQITSEVMDRLSSKYNTKCKSLSNL